MLIVSMVAFEVHIQDYFYPSRQDLSDQTIDESTWECWLGQWLEALEDYLPEAASYEVGLRLTDDREIQSLNATYRQVDSPTDVLAFPSDLSFGVPELPLSLGDIVISGETACRQAAQNAHELRLEVVWLATHGLLHLLGWDHPDADSLAAMLSEQASLMRLIGLPPVYV
jgi:probable rRNA maturation factor